MRNRGRMTIDPRSITMPERNKAGFQGRRKLCGREGAAGEGILAEGEETGLDHVAKKNKTMSKQATK